MRKEKLEELKDYILELKTIKRERLEEEYKYESGVACYNYSYLAKDCVKDGKQNLDKDEFIKYFECNIGEAYELINLGYITDIQSKYTMEKAKKYIKF